MKIRITNPDLALIRGAFDNLRAAHLDGIPNLEALKRRVVLSDLISSHLEHHPAEIRGEARWTCPWHHDTNPSFWAHDDFRDTGVGRWGCNPCGISGDAVDLLAKLHGYSTAEAIRVLRVWVNSHRSMRIHLRRASGSRRRTS
jgi:DNA primase